MSTNAVYGVIIAVLILLSGFFSCVETAFSFANTIRLKALVDNGNRKARHALWVCDNFDRALTAILIGNNVVNLGCSSLATILCLNLFANYGAAIATGGTTLLVLTFGEVIPKCIGKEKSDGIVLHTGLILKGLTTILMPLVLLFTGLKSLVMKIGHIKKSSPSVTEDELKYIIESIEEEGILEEQESELVQSALEFDEKTAQEILTPRVDVTVIDIGDSKEEIHDLIIRERYSRIPVYEGDIDNIIGILHTRDYLEKVIDGDADLRDLITPAHFIYKNQKLSAILSDFRANRLHIAIVTDEYGGFLGIVTMEDLLEEIVGDIWDEDEDIEHTCTKMGENRYLVSGDMDLSELFELFEMRPDDEIESNSVGGFIVEQLGDIPIRGQRVRYRDLSFTVKRVRNRRIISALAEKKPLPEQE
ncbi:hemolysin family protein [Ruminococcus sp.]|uniref:hemolysin family protein n=1 Tax=Ruminococcus sp. TaxID=41978 RepID=UPI00388E334D